jgi:hypothetical protein
MHKCCCACTNAIVRVGCAPVAVQVVQYVQLECLVTVKTPVQQQQQQRCHVHKYSVVWHDIYRVPVLYIAAAWPGGQGSGTAAGLALQH